MRWRSGLSQHKVLAGGSVLVLSALIVTAGLAASSAVSSTADTADPTTAPHPLVTQTAAPAAAAPSAEDQARADLEQLVRTYEEAENDLFLNPTLDPGPALAPYLKDQAFAARVADVVTFRRVGHIARSSSVVVHSVAVTQLELSIAHPTATLEVCGTISMSGTDGKSGLHDSYVNRGLTVWTAERMPDDSWRLADYDNPPERSC